MQSRVLSSAGWVVLSYARLPAASGRLWVGELSKMQTQNVKTIEIFSSTLRRGPRRSDVVLAHMPGLGKANAAAVAAHCQTSFPNIRLAVVVGVCGVVPFSRDGNEVVLGDVVISDGVIQYDLKRRLPERFTRKDTLLDSLGRPSTEIRSILAKLQGFRGRKTP